MTIIFVIAAVIAVFSLLIIPHELGHFWTAKRSGMQVDKFSLGLGPKLVGFKKGETEYSISLFPFGGFVKIRGMESGERDTPRGFHKQPLRNRILVLSAGSIANYLVAILLFSIVFMIGTYTYELTEAVIGEVGEDSPAESASLLPGDKILRVNGEKIEGWEGMALAIRKSEEEFLSLEVQRKDKILTLQVKPVFDPELGRKIIGVTPPTVFTRYNPITALLKGGKTTFFLTGAIFSALGGMIVGKVPAQFTGPVGIAQFIGESARMGLIPLLSLVALLSINLGLFNLFPIPALDGGRLFFLLVEKIRGRALDLEKEELIHYIGFIILISLILLITYQDVLRWTGTGG